MNIQKQQNFTIRNSKTVMKTLAFTVFTMKQLYEKSDVIAKVTLKGRSQAINTMCSKVEVLDIYKGKQNIDDSSIQVYEPFGILYNGDK